MKRFRLITVLMVLIAFASCKDDYETIFTSTLETTELSFTHEVGEHAFVIDSNEKWTIGDLPEWINVTVKDIEVSTTRSAEYDSGIKEVTISVTANDTYEPRTATIILSTYGEKSITLIINQDKKPELVGYWILSEGYAGQNNSEIGWYDALNDELKTKQFEVINGKKLGDTANELKQYGSKMYCLVSGPGFGDDTPEGEAYIEVINPKDGKSIKRIHFTDASGKTAKPRKIVFEEGKAYISSYSNEVVRLDTASLTLDAHATLSGELAEGLAYHNGNLYVCNSGQGEDNKISVVDIKTMKETNVITTAMNPTGIVSVGDDKLFFNTNYPDFEVYSLSTKDASITKINNMYGGDIAYLNNNVYSCFFDWDTFDGNTYKYDLTTNNTSTLDLDLKSVKIPMLMEYHIDVINGSTDLYLSGMGQDVVIFDSQTNEIKHAFEMKLAGVSGVVAVYR